jgi:hypothetical protein
VTVNAAETIEAIAYESGMTNSAVASAAYTIAPAVATPTFSPAAGAIPAGTQVTISSTTAGALISYATNGTTPSASGGTQSPVAVTVNAAETIEAIAYQSGMTNSAVATAAYTIAQNYTISGQVVVGGCPLPGVTVALSGGQSNSTQTNANGNYSFTVPGGANYTVTPSPGTYTFNPASWSTQTPLGANQTAVNFTASGPAIPSKEYIRLGGRVIAIANCGSQ